MAAGCTRYSVARDALSAQIPGVCDKSEQRTGFRRYVLDGCLLRVFRLMASFLRRLSLRHAVAGGVLGVSGLSASGLAHALRIEEDTKLDFKDVLLRPKRSELSSRAQVCAHP